MEDPIKRELLDRWRDVFRKTRARARSGEPASRAETPISTAPVRVLLEDTFWLTAWLPRYEVDDEYPRVEAADGRVPHRHRRTRMSLDSRDAGSRA